MEQMNGLTRRQALGAAAALCGAGVIAASGVGTAQAAGKLKVTIKDVPALKKVGGAAPVGSLNGRQIAVVRISKKTFLALDRTCPHQGAVVTPSGSGWQCPLHFSRFELDGDFISGPAGRDLRELKVRKRRGRLIITDN